MKRGPLRRITDRRQNFNETSGYPFGYVEETLECGHVRIEAITHEDALTHDDDIEETVREQEQKLVEFPDSRHTVNATRRRCLECKV